MSDMISARWEKSADLCRVALKYDSRLRVNLRKLFALSAQFVFPREIVLGSNCSWHLLFKKK